MMTETNYFESITQYDKQFDSYENFKFDKNACYIFAFLTAQEFMNTKMTNNANEHNRIIELSILNHKSLNMNGQQEFQTVMNLTDINEEINVTSVELIAENVIGFDVMFNDAYEKPYCVIFLKNSKFFVVTVSNEWYAIRDCHEMNQHNFKTKIELIDYLNLTYQFSNEIKINGYDQNLSDFSNVEFLIIDKQFSSCFDLTLDFNSSKNQYVDVEKKDYNDKDNHDNYFEDYDEDNYFV
jgi:hypothetical protein